MGEYKLVQLITTWSNLGVLWHTKTPDHDCLHHKMSPQAPLPPHQPEHIKCCESALGATRPHVNISGFKWSPLGHFRAIPSPNFDQLLGHVYLCMNMTVNSEPPVGVPQIASITHVPACPIVTPSVAITSQLVIKRWSKKCSSDLEFWTLTRNYASRFEPMNLMFVAFSGYVLPCVRIVD